MGSTRTAVDDFGLWIHLAGQVTEADAVRTRNEVEAILDGFDGPFCIVVDRRHLDAIESEAMAVFRSLMSDSAPAGLKRLAIVYDGRLLEAHIKPEELPPRFRESLRYFDASSVRDWKMETMQWVRRGEIPSTSVCLKGP